MDKLILIQVPLIFVLTFGLKGTMCESWLGFQLRCLPKLLTWSSLFLRFYESPNVIVSKHCFPPFIINKIRGEEKSVIALLEGPARIHIQSQQKSKKLEKKIGKCRLRSLILSTWVIVTDCEKYTKIIRERRTKLLKTMTPKRIVLWEI